MKPKQPFRLRDHYKFILPSLLGILLFMIPMPLGGSVTIPIAYLSNVVESYLAPYLSWIMAFIITITALLTLFAKVIPDKTLEPYPFMNKLLNVSWFWVITRFIGFVFVVLTLFKIGPSIVYSDNTGGLLLNDLLHVLFTVFLFAGFFLPLLLNYGLLELFGTLLSKIMRPLFRLPGRSSIDAIASWLGDGTIGVLLTSKQYEEGYYTKREAAVIGTTFSVVSITFSLVVIDQVELEHMFVPFYATVLLAGVVAAIIMPRIPPLSRKEDTYVSGEKQEGDPGIPEGYNALTWGYYLSVQHASKQTSVKTYVKQGAQNVLDMWMGVAPIVMAFGTIALMISETPFFAWIGAPFIPLLEWMNVPFAKEASETMLIGFADMFLPSIIAADIPSEMTRFIVATLSVTQLIYLSEVGGLILGSKIPVSFVQLFIIFLQRTLITLPVIVGMAHLLF
ncbi:membrane protein [Pontibacillus halophilus JSM 076056 = DSM 19796]|uniref:Membrane protein n=1 Tax=Pontibacillus halophilus JSM 076056 = DSM 19796 TaxID=1385510 RepID=A0A0A5GKL0_9BACI|nr:YjiH family protein [Pontibacillus halophilus]KGX93826.1 membrane protein [Pontibacillus halophilus JSM 076056 = DSM 19796]